MGNVSFIIVIIVIIVIRAWSSYNNQPSYRQNYGSDYRLYFVASGHNTIRTSDLHWRLILLSNVSSQTHYNLLVPRLAGR